VLGRGDVGDLLHCGEAVAFDEQNDFYLSQRKVSVRLKNKHCGCNSLKIKLLKNLKKVFLIGITWHK
jgi:hypothetical protein